MCKHLYLAHVHFLFANWTWPIEAFILKFKLSYHMLLFQTAQLGVALTSPVYCLPIGRTLYTWSRTRPRLVLVHVYSPPTPSHLHQQPTSFCKVHATHLPAAQSSAKTLELQQRKIRNSKNLKTAAKKLKSDAMTRKTAETQTVTRKLMTNKCNKEQLQTLTEGLTLLQKHTAANTLK